MVLENLLTLVEKLRERIDSHGDALRQSEALTRYALIDPLLRELGWDTEDPDVVVPEDRLPNKQIPDYILYQDNGDPAIVIESKKLDEPLDGKALNQGILYCAHTGASYFILTDGNHWELYESGSTSPMTNFNLTGASSADTCLKALALWRPSVISGQIAGGETPVIGLPGEQPSTTEPQPTEETTVQPTPPVSDEEGWQTLSEFNPQSGDPKPTEILFPDNSKVSIDAWKALMIEVARWLIDNNILDTDHCPIQGVGKAKRYLVSTTPTHLELKNKPLFKRGEQLGSLHIETNYSGPDCVDNAQHIIQHVGRNPAQFKVRLP